jgi:hypothetical protein
MQVLIFAGLFPTLIGLFVLFHLFRPQKSPADASNRINKIRLFWFALTRENLFVDSFPWLKNDELKNITIESITVDKDANRVWNIKVNEQQFAIVTDNTGRFILKINSPESGYTENDPILVYQFNKCVHAQNVNMADDVRGSLLVRIPHQVKDYLPTTAYPRIDPQTMTLEWYIAANALQ